MSPSRIAGARPSVRDAVLLAITRAHERLTPEGLARQVAVSRRALTRRLEAAGFPAPHALLTWGRLVVAARLLETGQLLLAAATAAALAAWWFASKRKVAAPAPAPASLAEARAILGIAATDDAAAAPLMEVVKGTVVVRGAQAMAPRELLPLRLPEAPVEDAPAEDDPAAGRAPLDPLERGPEITEVR